MADVQSAGNGHSASSILEHLNIDEASQVMDQTKAVMEQAVETASTFIRERPIVCLAGAVAIGYLIGKIVSR